MLLSARVPLNVGTGRTINTNATDRDLECLGIGLDVPAWIRDQLIDVVNPTGALGIPGLYVPSDPAGVDANAKKGALSINFGKLFEKGLRLGTGQCNVKRYNAYLRDLIVAGKAKPSFVVSHEIPLADAPDAYTKFDKRIDGYTKVILKP